MRKKGKRDQRGRDVSPIECPERIGNLETETSPAKTLIVLQGVWTDEQAAKRETFGKGEQSSRSDYEVSLGKFSTERSRSSSERELQISVEMVEESIAQILGRDSAAGLSSKEGGKCIMLL